MLIGTRYKIEERGRSHSRLKIDADTDVEFQSDEEHVLFIRDSVAISWQCAFEPNIR